ncbi:TetR/AcrR family transcriptional regulator [Brenneria tiliae]|uniref:TetR/AcrR family transcriptional regulator n=1 Tax=Brenneria tiliae TaxID=2914984 RepID=A0ABT0MYX4_9GAMM|nr:TetR/AcrR family transcriptional regulator [Brenneria tiliae]MCL2895046.1 TetR/AcrR family transcriptional regulator [Brenneria tiliae]
MENKKTVKSRTSSGSSRSAATHQAILNAAIALLAERGYAGFTIEAVAKNAGASKPTIYRWWPNKAQLIAEVYEHESARSITIPDDLPVKKQFSLLLHSLWSLWNNTICGEAFRSFIAESQLVKENMDLLRDEFMARRFELPLKILKQGVARGELSEDINIDLLLHMTFGFCWFHLLTDNLHDTALIDDFINRAFGTIQESKK